MSNEDVNNTGDVILAMITSVAKAEVMSIEVNNTNVSIPLPKDNFVKCHKVVTMSQSLILKTISTANSDFVDKVADRIRLLIGDTPLTNRLVMAQFPI